MYVSEGFIFSGGRGSFTPVKRKIKVIEYVAQLFIKWTDFISQTQYNRRSN